MLDYTQTKAITSSLEESIRLVMEGKYDFTTGDVTIHPKNKNDISDHLAKKESLVESLFHVHCQYGGKGAYKQTGTIESNPEHPTIKAYYAKRSLDSGNKYQFVPK
jgi:hypothetical protein